MVMLASVSPNMPGVGVKVKMPLLEITGCPCVVKSCGLLTTTLNVGFSGAGSLIPPEMLNMILLEKFAFSQPMTRRGDMNKGASLTSMISMVKSFSSDTASMCVCVCV